MLGLTQREQPVQRIVFSCDEAIEAAGTKRAEFSHEQAMTIAVLLGASASLALRWRSRYGFMIRYAVYWLAIAGVFLAGYAAWWGIL